MKSLFFSLLFLLILTAMASAQSLSQTRKSNNIITEKAWINATPQAVAAVDDQYMYTNKITGSNTGNTRFTNFGFNIPGDARVDSMKCNITRFQKGRDVLYDADAGFTKKCEYSLGSCLFRRVKSGEKWTATKSVATFTDYEFGKNLSGVLTTQWFAADINDPNFGFNFLAATVKGTSSANPYVDYVEITVFYTPLSSARLSTQSPALLAPTADPGFIAKALGGTKEERVQTFGHTIDGGYFAGGVTQSNDGDVTGALGGMDMWLVKLDNNLNIKWKLCIGSRNNEEGAIVRELASGDFVVAGNTVDAKGNRQILIARVSKDGKLLWQKTLGGTGDDRLASIELFDNQYFLLSAETSSNNGDVAGNHGGYDTWILKVSSDTGIPLWKTTVGGLGNEYTRTVQKTPDGGVILCAMTRSIELPGYKGESDALIAKLSAGGVQEWMKVLGNTSFDQQMMIKVRPLGDYIFALAPSKNDGDFAGTNTGGDIWVQQIAPNGSLGWKNNFGTNATEDLNDLQIMADNRILIAGSIGSNIWALNISQDGSLIWQNSLGGSKQDVARAIRNTTDGGYFIMGYTNSFDGDVVGSHATAANTSFDTWLIKLNADGSMAWNKAYGGTGQDWYCDCGTVPYSFLANDPIGMRYPANYFTSSFLQDAAGNFYFAVPTTSKDGDVTGLHYSKASGTRTDIWFVKITPAASSARLNTNQLQENNFAHSLYPNPAKQQVLLSFKAIETGKTILELYTAKGVRVSTRQLAPSIKGQIFRQQINISGLVNGTYFYRLISGKNIVNGMFIKTN